MLYFLSLFHCSIYSIHYSIWTRKFLNNTFSPHFIYQNEVPDQEMAASHQAHVDFRECERTCFRSDDGLLGTVGLLCVVCCGFLTISLFYINRFSSGGSEAAAAEVQFWVFTSNSRRQSPLQRPCVYVGGAGEVPLQTAQQVGLFPRKHSVGWSGGTVVGAEELAPPVLWGVFSVKFACSPRFLLYVVNSCVLCLCTVLKPVPYAKAFLLRSINELNQIKHIFIERGEKKMAGQHLSTCFRALTCLSVH